MNKDAVTLKAEADEADALMIEGIERWLLAYKTPRVKRAPVKRRPLAKIFNPKPKPSAMVAIPELTPRLPRAPYTQPRGTAARRMQHNMIRWMK